MKHLRNVGIYISVVPLFVLTSCETFIPPERTVNELALPETFTLYEEETPKPNRWWESFESGDLELLMNHALQENLTLQQMYARRVQAEMLARQAGAARWPSLNVTGDTSFGRRHTDTGMSPNTLDTANQRLSNINTIISSGGNAQPGTGLDAVSSGLLSAKSKLQAIESILANTPSSDRTFGTESYRYGISSSYEVDLWGRVKAQQQATLLDFEASSEDVYSAMLSLSGSVTRQWLLYVAYQQELAVALQQLKFNKTTLELMELRFRKGLATALDVYQQRQIVARTESLIPSLESRMHMAQNELNVLLGKYPGIDLDINTETLPDLGPIPESGLPADLLANRPDVRIAGLRLRSADWRVAAARADRLPSLRLSASASYGADDWELVFDNWMANLAGSLTGPIFDAGRRKAEVLRTRAVVNERLAAYRQTVLRAVNEVENAMFQETKQAEYIEALERQLSAARTSHDQAQERYRKGMNDYLPVLSALSELQVLERSLVQAKLDRMEFRVQLYLALGGSWMRQELTILED